MKEIKNNIDCVILCIVFVLIGIGSCICIKYKDDNCNQCIDKRSSKTINDYKTFNPLQNNWNLFTMIK